MLYNRFAHECNWLNILLICILRFFEYLQLIAFIFFAKRNLLDNFTSLMSIFLLFNYFIYYFIILLYLFNPLEYYSRFLYLDDFTKRRIKVVTRLFFEFFLNMKSVNDEKNIKKKFWKFGFVCLSVTLSFSVFTNSVL